MDFGVYFKLVTSFSYASFSSNYFSLFPPPGRGIECFFRLLLYFSFGSFLSTSPGVVLLFPVTVGDSSSFFVLYGLSGFTVVALSKQVSSFLEGSLEDSSPSF